MNQIEKSMPLVSVIIPVYNAEQTICETLDSVFSQSHKNLQVIVVDDASTDGSLEKIKNYTDTRLEIIQLAVNGNICAARNCALDQAKGDYIAFLDGDDIWMPTKIEKQVAFLEKEPSFGACFTWAEIIDENSCTHSLENPEIAWFHDVFHEGNRSHREWFMRLLTGGNFFCCSSSLVRAEIVRKIGKQNLILLQLQDFEYWIRVLSHCDVHIICEELTRYRRIIDGNSLSADNDVNRARTSNENIYICKQFFDYISDELFISLFQDEFRNPGSETSLELACEKAFLLEKAYCGKEPSLASLEHLLGKDESAKVLIEKFGYGQKDFYKENAQRRYFDSCEYQRLSERINWLLKDVADYNQRIKELSEQIDLMVNSKSWKITKPLRAVMKIIHM